MKISPYALAVVAALLGLTTVAAFVPNSCRVDQGHVLTRIEPFSTTTCHASSEMDVEETSASSSSPTFPFSDTQVRFAYDEWRLIYGKGDFDRKRFENFKLNHKTLTISNLKAREKAVKDGRPIPQWMSLNEYGDYSLDEYEAMMRGEKPLVNDDQSAKGNEAGEQLVRGTQPVQNDVLVNYNGGQVQEYQDQFGRTIRSTQALVKDAPLPSDSSLQSVTADSNYANNIDSIDANSRGTLIIPKDENDNNGSQPRVTQRIGTNDGSSAVRGTQVVGAGPAFQGTQAIVSNSFARGTQVVSPAGGAGSGTSYGTQVISGAGGRGTQVLGSGDDQNRGSQTYVLQSDPDEEAELQPAEGTLMIPREKETQFIPKGNVGTQIIPKGDGGTQIISNMDTTDDDSKGKNDLFPNIFDGLFGDSKKEEDKYDNNAVGKRGTMVIKRSFEVPEEEPMKNPFSFFGTGSADEEKKDETEIQDVGIQNEPEPAKPNIFFDFLSPKNNSTAVKEEEVNQEQNKTGSGIFSLFGGDVKSEGTRPVRTSISLQTQAPKGIKLPGFGSRRETKLISDEAENDTGTPSILSFFGGAKKVKEDDSEPNLVVQKPKKFEWVSATSSVSRACMTVWLQLI